MRRLLAATGGPAFVPPDPLDPVDPELPEEPTLPYAFPTSAPWNVPNYCITPTPDDTGSALHPSVLDFGGEPWQGWRFWMGVTPMWQGIEELENPCILVSADGYEWQPPEGLTNPVFPDPDGAGPAYNSDTELLYEAAQDRLVLFWRELDPTGPTEYIWRTTSTDGVTWTPKQVAIQSASTIKLISPTVAEFGGGYAMWVIEENSLVRYTMPTLTSTINPATRTYNANSPAPGVTFTPAVNRWHVAIIKHGDRYYGLLLDTSTITKKLIPMTADLDGVFLLGPAVLEPVPGDWGTTEVYRGALQVHQDGEHMRVWYSGNDDGTLSWRVGYTRIPLSAWPAI